MADIAITAANVEAATGAVSKEEGVAGAAITAGQALYKDTAASNVLKLAQCDGTALEATVAGIALHNAASGQPIVFAKTGNMDLGATLAIGDIVVLSATPGGLRLATEMVASDYVSVIGVCTAADNLLLGIVNSAVELHA